ncbi:MAG: hypothetical protein M3P18_02895, partial [Actinomycetota bacterium]|nr:hypothetical protein [Actinomycetota bacterium]
MANNCVKCGIPIVQSGQGRPSLYCSKECRRAGEYELRRIQHQLEELEDRERSSRQDRDGIGFGSGRPKKILREELAWHQAE